VVRKLIEQQLRLIDYLEKRTECWANMILRMKFDLSRSLLHGGRQRSRHHPQAVDVLIIE
jgi:hypothetical protein